MWLYRYLFLLFQGGGVQAPGVAADVTADFCHARDAAADFLHRRDATADHCHVRDATAEV